MMPTIGHLCFLLSVVLTLGGRDGYSQSMDSEDGEIEYSDKMPEYSSRSNLPGMYRGLGMKEGYGSVPRNLGLGRGILNLIRGLVNKYGQGSAGEGAKVTQIITQTVPIIQDVVSIIENLFNQGGAGSGLPPFHIKGNVPESGGGGGLDNSDKPAFTPDYSDPGDDGIGPPKKMEGRPSGGSDYDSMPGIGNPMSPSFPDDSMNESMDNSKSSSRPNKMTKPNHKGRPTTMDRPRPNSKDEDRPNSMDEDRPNSMDEDRPNYMDEDRPNSMDEDRPNFVDKLRPNSKDKPKRKKSPVFSPDSISTDSIDVGEADSRRKPSMDEMKPDMTDSRHKDMEDEDYLSSKNMDGEKPRPKKGLPPLGDAKPLPNNFKTSRDDNRSIRIPVSRQGSKVVRKSPLGFAPKIERNSVIKSSKMKSSY